MSEKDAFVSLVLEVIYTFLIYVVVMWIRRKGDGLKKGLCLK